MTGVDLTKQVSKSNNYMATRLRGEMSFTTDDLDEISRALGVSVEDIISAAVQAMLSQSSYGLAAKDADPRIGKDDIPEW